MSLNIDSNTLESHILEHWGGSLRKHWGGSLRKHWGGSLRKHFIVNSKCCHRTTNLILYNC